MNALLNQKTIGFLLLALLGNLSTASAYYDPNAQRWINRDPLGDIGNPVALTADIAPWSDLDNIVPDGQMTDAEMQNAWIQVNLNLHVFALNSPLDYVDPDGRCPAFTPDIGIFQGLSPEQEVLASKMAAPLAVGIAVPEVLGVAAGEFGAGAGIARIAQKIFGGGSWLNKGRYLRIGTSPYGGRKVFRISGEWVKLIKKDGHIIIRDCGPL